MTPRLSVVMPVYNEAAVVADLVERIDAACEEVGEPAEIVVVDDASTDGTGDLLRSSGVARLRPVFQAVNGGQFVATRAGLATSAGDLVVVLDGDGQDPPELIPELVAAARRAPGRVVFATKRIRHDPAWFRAGRRGYALGLALLGARIPSGAGSFCALPGALARRAARVPLRDANLAPTLIALGAEVATHPYDRGARVDGGSRVGPAGLAREALGSWFLLSPVGRLWLARAVQDAGPASGD